MSEEAYYLHGYWPLWVFPLHFTIYGIGFVISIIRAKGLLTWTRNFSIMFLISMTVHGFIMSKHLRRCMPIWEQQFLNAWNYVWPVYVFPTILIIVIISLIKTYILWGELKKEDADNNNSQTTFLSLYLHKYTKIIFILSLFIFALIAIHFIEK